MDGGWKDGQVCSEGLMDGRKTGWGVDPMQTHLNMLLVMFIHVSFLCERHMFVTPGPGYFLACYN